MIEPNHDRIIGNVEQAQDLTDQLILRTPSGNKRNLYTEANILLLSAVAKLNEAKRAR